jgi:hypothetical protein
METLGAVVIGAIDRWFATTDAIRAHPHKTLLLILALIVERLILNWSSP